jgi:fucose permease
MNIEILLGSTLLFVGLIQATTLLFTSVSEVFIGFFLNGLCFGMIETAVNIQVIRLWGKDCGIFIQTLYFGFGLGCVLSPLFASPALTPTFEELEEATGNITDYSTTNIGPEDVKIHFVYIAIGCYLTCVGFAFFISYFQSKSSKALITTEHVDLGGEINGKVTCWETCLVVTSYSSAFLFSFIYSGIAISVGSFLTAFAVETIGVTKATGAYLTSTYWVSFTFSRLATILYFDYVGPKVNMTGALILTLIANIFLLFLGTSGGWCLWFSVAFYGIAMSSIWATLFSFIAHFIPMSNCLTSLIMFGCALGESAIQILISVFIESTPMVFLYVSLSCSVVMIGSFATLWMSLHYQTKETLTTGATKLTNQS